jgi:hypothetical protein
VARETEKAREAAALAEAAAASEAAAADDDAAAAASAADVPRASEKAREAAALAEAAADDTAADAEAKAAAAAAASAAKKARETQEGVKMCSRTIHKIEQLEKELEEGVKLSLDAQQLLKVRRRRTSLKPSASKTRVCLWQSIDESYCWTPTPSRFV